MFKKLLVLIITAFVDMVGLLMVIPLMPFYARTMGASALMVTVLVCRLRRRSSSARRCGGASPIDTADAPRLLVGLGCSGDCLCRICVREFSLAAAAVASRAGCRRRNCRRRSGLRRRCDGAGESREGARLAVGGDQCWCCAWARRSARCALAGATAARASPRLRYASSTWRSRGSICDESRDMQDARFQRQEARRIAYGARPRVDSFPASLARA